MRFIKKILLASLSAATAAAISAAIACPSGYAEGDSAKAPADSLALEAAGPADAPLTEEDYAWAADSLRIDVAAIHAVVEVEAGVKHKGIWAPGKPLVAFSANLFRTHARKRNISLNGCAAKYPEVFSSPMTKKYGSYEAAQWARLRQAMEIDSVCAICGAYWGMFQIAGEHWKFCGCQSPQEMAMRMCASEREQLAMFVTFLQRTGMDAHLRGHQWARFARRYNGPSYARRGYHTKLARAYKKYSSLPSLHDKGR